MAKFLKLGNGTFVNVEMIVEIYKSFEFQSVPGTEDPWGNVDQERTGKVHVMVNVAGKHSEVRLFNDEHSADAFISETFEIA